MQALAQISVSILLVSFTYATYNQGSNKGQQQYDAPMPYNFQWGVKDAYSKNDYSHTQSNDGKTTQGEYRVQLPDGRLQIVKFYDNGDGYHADVTYEGVAQYPPQQKGGYGGHSKGVGSSSGSSGYSAPKQNSYGG